MLADPELEGSKQPYHAAAGLPLRQAECLVQSAIESSRGLALEAIQAAMRALGARKHEVVGCGLTLASGKSLPDLARVLASHALIHTAEGELFRQALIWSAQECGLPVTCVKEKELDPSALQRLDSLGKLIGPPWTQDQKYAAAAAFLELGPR